MSLRKRWRDLDRSAVGAAPNRYGVYELGDEDGNVVETDWGMLRDEVKDALAYDSAAKVRWQTAQNEDHAKRLADEHRS